MSKSIKRTISVILLLCLLMSVVSVPAFSAELTDITELDLNDATLKKIYFKVETDKDFAAYAVDEEIAFTATLWADMDTDSNRDNDIRISAPYFKYTILGDDGKKESGYADASSGQVVLKTRLSCAGAVRLELYPVDSNKTWISSNKITMFEGGAIANASEIQVTVQEPDDFDEFWRKQLSELDAVEPELTYIKEIPSEKDGFKVYEIRIACVEDSCETSTGTTYATGFLTVPINAGKKTLGITVEYYGYGVFKSDPFYSPSNIYLRLNAHSIPQDQETSYYEALRAEGGVLKDYGFNAAQNADPKTSYFRNMLLRDVQAIRFLKKYFGDGVSSEVNGINTAPWSNVWNEKYISVWGTSQGGFQAIAVAGLVPEVTKVDVIVPWFSDVAGNTDPNKIQSTFRPEYAPGLAYYDTALFAKRIKASTITIEAGTGDTLCPVAGVQAIYNNLVNESAKIVYTQGRTHSSTQTYPIDSVQSRDSAPVITGTVDNADTKLTWELNLSTNALTLRSDADSGENATGVATADGAWAEIADRATEIIIAGNITKISASAFEGHTNVKKITLPSSSIQIESEAFKGCDALSEICISGSAVIAGAADLSLAGDSLASGKEILAGTAISGIILDNAYSTSNPIIAENLPETLNTVYGPHDSEYIRSFCEANSMNFVPYGTAVERGCAWIYDEDEKTVSVFGNGAFVGFRASDAEYLAMAEKLVIASEINELGEDSFATLTGLTGAEFLGDAPKAPAASKPFGVREDTFVITVNKRASGFKGTTWLGYTLNKITNTTGDINGDGSIDTHDAILLSQYLAGWRVSIDKTMADVSGDYKVSAIDAVLFAQYLAEWDVKFAEVHFGDADYGENEVNPGDIW